MKFNSITVVGGGSSGWMTAATLIKAFPNKKITVIESKDVPIIGVGESTLGSIRRWTRFIGLDEASFFTHTDASYKLSIKFTDFYKKDSGSFHYPFGKPIQFNNENPFTDWHFKKFIKPETPIEDFVRCLFPGAALFENNKFSENLNGEFDNFNIGNDVAYHFDAVKFGIWLRDKYCIPAGVKHIIGTVVSVTHNNNGVETLVLDDQSFVTSDLFVDCTGFKSLLLGETLKEPFDSYADMLPNNKAWAVQVPYKNRTLELEGFTNCTARENGWCWNIPLWSRLGTGYVYSDKFVTKEQALEEFKQYLMSNKMIVPRTREEIDLLNFKEITMRVGIHKRTFVKNVVAIGLAAGFIEPLESNGLFSVHEFLFKLVDILQRDQISQFDRDMYNISIRDLFDNFAKFVVLHYALSHRNDSEYWQSIQTTSFSDRLGDPYNQTVSRVDTFYNMIWRYMEEWAHPFSTSKGITYIATGMNFQMINESRAQSISYDNDFNIHQRVDHIDSQWDLKKEKWNKNLKSCPTLESYLKTKFYS